MKRVKQALVVAMMTATVVAAVPFAAIGLPPTPCAPPHRLQVLGLEMIPDPIHQGQPIQGWRVTLRSDYNGECVTLLVIKDRDQIAGAQIEHLILPGVHPYTFRATPNYQFQAGDHCYVVFAYIGATPAQIDAARLFCARYRPPMPASWSLK